MNEANTLLAEAAANLGQGRIPEALAQAQQALALAPESPGALHLMGLLLAMSGQDQPAEDHLGRAIEINRRSGVIDGQLIVNHALFLRQRERLEEAEPHLHALLQADPENLQANMLYGQLLTRRHEMRAALPYLVKAAEPESAGAEACYRLARVFEEVGDTENAEACFKTAIAREPENSTALNYYGLFLTGQGRADDAILALQKSLQHTSEHAAQVLYNLGNAYMAENRTDEAIDAYRRSIRIDPGSPETHAHLGFALMARGDYPEGFSEYEWRLKTDAFAATPLQAPMWDGGALDGKTILLVGEQGVGDVIQFLRFVPDVAERGGRIILRAPASLKALLEAVPNIEAVITPEDPIPDHDVAAPLMSLPRILGTTATTIPNHIPYLVAPEDKVQDWHGKLAEFTGRKVGLVWMGNPDQFKNKFRSCPVEILAPLADVPGVHMFSLQKHAHGDPLNLPPRIINLGREFKDFSDTAAAIANLDLVISVCTSVAHLTGALGKPLWVMLAHAPDWRWQLEMDRTPWYPTARLFRQDAPGDWPGVVDQIIAALNARPSR